MQSAEYQVRELLGGLEGQEVQGQERNEEIKAAAQQRWQVNDDLFARVRLAKGIPSFSKSTFI